MPFLAPVTSSLNSRQMLSYTGGWANGFEADQSARNTRYAFNEAFLGNRVYRAEDRGGFRETIFKDTFDLTCTPELRLVGAYNPIPAIVAAYQNVFRGAFGQEIKVSDKVNGKPVNAPLIDEANSPIARIWQWSNLNTEKQLLQEWAANLGTVGLRVVAQNDAEPANKRVFLQIENPSVIYDYDSDARGNVTAVELRYKVKDGEIGDREDVEVREVLTKDRFVKEVGGKDGKGGKNVLEPEEQVNELGVCPYVILKHRDEGTQFGRWAYAGAEDTIHWINWLIVNEGQAIMEHARPDWFAAAGGPAPGEPFILGGKRVAYVQMQKDMPTPIFAPLVAPLDHAGPLAFMQEQVAWLHERQPELAIVAMKVLSGQSGETIAKLQVQAEAAIKRARAQYEHKLTCAIQIGLSEGVRMNLWNLGTGMGSAEAADAAYQQGKEDFEFVERAALPPTPFDRITQAKANVAEQMEKYALASAAMKTGVVSDRQAMRDMGMTEEEIAQNEKEIATLDIEPDPVAAVDFKGRANGNGKAAARR